MSYVSFQRAFRPYRCSKCGEQGHQARACGRQVLRVPNSVPRVQKRAAEKRTVWCRWCKTEAHWTRQCPERVLAAAAKREAKAARGESVKLLPLVVSPGDEFIVVEDCGEWVQDGIWFAECTTGKVVEQDGRVYSEWILRHVDTHLQCGFPQLHPFMRRPPASATFNIPMLGLGGLWHANEPTRSRR